MRLMGAIRQRRRILGGLGFRFHRAARRNCTEAMRESVSSSLYGEEAGVVRTEGLDSSRAMSVLRRRHPARMSHQL
jgi:hypothetical protein